MCPDSLWYKIAGTSKFKNRSPPCAASTNFAGPLHIRSYVNNNLCSVSVACEANAVLQTKRRSEPQSKS